MVVPTITYQKVRVASIGGPDHKNLNMMKMNFRQPVTAGKELERKVKVLDLSPWLAGALILWLGMKMTFMIKMKRIITTAMMKSMISSSMTWLKVKLTKNSLDKISDIKNFKLLDKTTFYRLLNHVSVTINFKHSCLVALWIILIDIIVIANCFKQF